MTFKIAIASGKGGTGKTTVSINLFNYLKQDSIQNIQLIDCDVEEPNDLLFFEGTNKMEEIPVHQQIPQIDTSKCIFCKKCVDYCEFNAISVINKVKHAEITASNCHSCGACLVACPANAIYETESEIGSISCYLQPNGAVITEGRLNIGSTMQTKVIRETKKQAKPNKQVILYDAPPGTSCPVVETISNTNYVVLVTEPTPFGIHDMQLMVELLQELEIPFGIIINKAGLGNNETLKYIHKNQLELLGEIPFSKAYASNYATGNLTKNIPKEIEKAYQNIVQSVISNINSK